MRNNLPHRFKRMTTFRLYHLFFGLIALGTLLYDTSRNTHQIVNYYSYFTTLSVVLTTLIFLLIGIRGNNLKKINFDVFRGAIVIYMLVSAAVYAILLAGIADATRVWWIDFVLHKFLPAAVLFGWILFPPFYYIKLRYILTWLVFPIAYIAYTLLRGTIAGWYPYFFLNPIQNNYFGVVSFSFKIVLASLITSILIIVIGNIRGSKN